MKEELTKTEGYGLTETQKTKISKTFQVLEEEKVFLVKSYNEVIKKEITPELAKEAKVLDSKLQKHLKAKKEIHTANKAFFLNGGRYVDSIFNIEKVDIELMREAAQRIVKFEDNKEKERLDKLQNERVALLCEFVDDASERTLNTMDDDVWEAYLEAKKKAHFDLLETERLAEEKRQQEIKAEKEEQERIRKENEKLKVQALEAKRLAKIESDKRAKADEERNEKARIEYLKAVEKEAAIKEAHELQLKKERELREKAELEERAKIKKLQDDLKAKEESEKLANEQKELALQQELSKGDSDKVLDLIADLNSLKEKYIFDSDKNKSMYGKVKILIDKVVGIIN